MAMPFGFRGPIDQQGMAEATRLTRAGRLGEATALIQRLLRGDAVPPGSGEATPTADDWSGPTLDLTPEAEPAPNPAAEKAYPGNQAWPGAWQGGVYENPFGRRPYKLYVPAARPAGALPLVVMLHGCTQDPDDFALGTGMNRLAEEAGLLVVYPGQVTTANRAKCWNWFQPTDQEREQGEPSLIAGIAREVVARHGADPARVYVAGLSAGGAKAAIMARAYPDLFAAVGVHSGVPDGSATGVPSALAAMRKPKRRGRPAGSTFVPTIVFHGARDRTVHPGNGEAILAAALAAAGPLTAERHTDQVPGGHSYRRTRHRAADGATLVEDWRIDGLGHAWSGGDPRGSYTDPRGPDASRAMLDFFLQHRLTPTA
jgi:poly(hydroxyalkanoate) depolymerase family esterase